MPRSSNNSRKATQLLDDNLSSVDDHEGLSEEGKMILDRITDKLNIAVTQILSKFDEHLHKIVVLEKQVAEYKHENIELRERLDDVECEQRGSSLIISGDAVPCSVDGENVASVVSDLVKNKLNYKLPHASIVAAYRLGKKSASQAPDKRSILLKVNHSDTKNDLRRAARSVKPSSLFINENLIPRRAKILRTLRAAKRRFPGKVSACGSQNGRIYVWLTSSSDTGKNLKVFVNCEDKLDDICVKTFGLHFSEISASK